MIGSSELQIFITGLESKFFQAIAQFYLLVHYYTSILAVLLNSSPQVSQASSTHKGKKRQISASLNIYLVSFCLNI